MMKTRRAAMGRAGLGAAVFLSFADILFGNPAVSFWERAAALASLGFFVGIVCFGYGESSVKKTVKLRKRVRREQSTG
jgi:hypothetical protein